MLRDLQSRFEQASRLYADTNGIERDTDWFFLKLHEEVGELTQACNRFTGRGRTKGRTEDELRRDIEDEAADVFGHILLFAAHHGLDLPAAIERKWRFRPSSSPQAAARPGPHKA